MKVVIVGCGRMGVELATRLFERGHEVSVIDANEAAFAKLPAAFAGRINQGEAINREVLHRAGIESADAVAAVTDSDVLNGVVGHLARTFYDISNVVVRNTDPRYRPLLEAYGLQVISALSWGAQRIEEMLYHGEVRTVFSAGNGEVEIYEITVPDHWGGHSLGEFLAQGEYLAVSITRAGRAALPAAEMQLEQGDVVHVSATLEGVQALRSKILAVQ